MPLKRYGVYLAYPPNVDLKYQGLGRYLAMFLKAAISFPDVRFVVACPSWSKKDLLELCRQEGIPASAFDILTTPGEPALLRSYNWYQRYRRRPARRSPFVLMKRRLRATLYRHQSAIERRIATSRSLASLTLWLLYIVLIGLLFSPLIAIASLARSLQLRLAGAVRRMRHMPNVVRNIERVNQVASDPKNEPLMLRMYRHMERSETDLLIDRINALSDVRAWYSPTAFWPSFKKIKRPRLTCVPDVLLRDFPTGFSSVGGDRYLETFHLVETSIRDAQHLVTYSHSVKWNTLVDEYGVDPGHTDVVPHAGIDLSRYVRISGAANSEVAERKYAEQLVLKALHTSRLSHYAGTFRNGAFKFIFYASQFRPSKNIINLLRAYEYLLRNRFVTHKLVLTGDARDMPDIEAFIREHNLTYDVLCVPGLSLPQLSACYKLADLAVNPSLSEGGCPFTFSEAASVGTPVVMARISVSQEVLDDATLQDVMMFDPYDWRDMARCIEWGLNNADELREAQRDAYKKISSRTWRNVVEEHIAIFERIADNATKPHRVIS